MNDWASTNGRKKAGLTRLLLRCVIIVAALFVVLALLGFSYQAVEAARDAKRFPQIGKSVDVGGYKLNVNCTGRGAPTVVLESALGVTSTGWGKVQPEIARFARVCSYDRAGYGWSEAGPLPRTSLQLARELRAVLQNAGERPPYIMVGHSFGGADVRMFNGLYPGEVAGMVLAETGLVNLSFPPSIQKLVNQDLARRERETFWFPIRSKLGWVRLAARKQVEDPGVAFEDRRDAYFGIQPKFVLATTSEAKNSKQDAEELKGSGTLGDKPLIVLSAAKDMLGMPLNDKDWRDLHDVWVGQVQARLARLSTRGKQIVLSDSGHMIPFERPDAIVSAVSEVRAATN